MDGFQAAIGVACFDPQSPTTDSVHGIRFIEAEDMTEEISSISDLEDQISLAGENWNNFPWVFYLVYNWFYIG